MAGIKGLRVDYTEKGPAGKDTRTGENKQDSSVPAPIRAGVPVGGVENEFTENDSAAKPTTRPNSGK